MLKTEPWASSYEGFCSKQKIMFSSKKKVLKPIWKDAPWKMMAIPIMNAQNGATSVKLWRFLLKQSFDVATKVPRKWKDAASKLIECCYENDTVLLRKWYDFASKVIRFCFENDTVLLRERYDFASKMIRFCFENDKILLRKHLLFWGVAYSRRFLFTPLCGIISASIHFQLWANWNAS